jgi:sensor histidine kinase YesM
MIKPLSEEVDFVTRYCEVQKLRFKERFDWSIDVDNSVNLQREIPKLTIQIFVENAIKHGIENKRGGGRVDINLLNNGSGLEISVTDTGIGRIAARKENSSGTGNGIRLITGLFDQMNIVNRNRAFVEVTDLTDNDNKAAGTRVKVFIPDDYRFGSAEKI